MHRTHPSAVLKCQQKLRSCTQGRGTGCPLLNSLSFPSSNCLISQTSSLLPPNLLRRRLGRTNTGYSTPRQELPDSESTTEPPRCRWKAERRLSVCQGHGIAGQRLRELSREEFSNGTAPRLTSAASSNVPCSAASTRTV